MISYVSLRWKLAALIIGGSALTALIVVAGFAWFDLSRLWQNTGAQAGAIADIIAAQIGPALELGDRSGAREILDALRSDPTIDAAVIYDAHYACFAAFRRSGGSDCQAGAPATSPRPGGSIVVNRPVRGGGERFGTLELSVNLPSVPAVIRHYLGGAALILLLSLFVATGAAMTLQSKVSRPILAMARFAERVAKTHRFEDRVALTSSDELGVLAAAFNTMLEELERRDTELNRHRHSLEDEIAERNRVNGELRIAKEKAEEAAHLKSEFLANMSHEIRTPMNGVVGMIGLVLETCTDAAQREQLQVARDAGQSLVSILNDILDLSKIEAGKMTLETIDFELETLLRDALQIFNISIRDKGLALCVAVADECPRSVRGDPVRLRQIVLNLVGNAVKFTREGSVTIAVRPAGAPGTLRFEVSDTGIGIPSSKLSSIFDAFTQADGSHTRRFGGTGLGLAITRRLVDLMGGRLWAASEPGRGSSFFVDLPLPAAAPSEERCAASTEEATPACSLLPLRVLVAEDNIINQKVVAALLARQGWSVALAADGRETVRRFQAETFDLILMDVQMPEMDGLEATRLIRREEQLRGPEVATRIPIVALTANASLSQREECLASGMDDVITKPIDRRKFLETITGVVSCAAACR